jgi:drug/metabolite transporter (DMT)-like permease
VGWRFAVAALATLALVLVRGGAARDVLDLRPLGPRGVATLALIGLLQTGGVMSLLFLSMRSVSAATAAVLLFTNPIWVAVLGRVFLHERMREGAAAGLALGVAGTALAIGLGDSLLAGREEVSLRGELTGLGAALCWAVSTILHKRARLPVGAWKLSFWQMLVGSAAVLALAAATGEHWPAHTSASQWGWFLWLAVPASTGSFGLWYVALERGGAVRTSSYLFLAPLFAVLLSWIVLGTVLTPLQGLGAALIGLALWLVNR